MNKGMFALTALASLATVTLSGCAISDAADMAKNKVSHNYAVLEGMPMYQNSTPYSRSLQCIAQNVFGPTGKGSSKGRFTLAVGQIKDLTGKYDYENGGYKVTQGASDMLVSSLFKTNAFHVVERNNMEITELERSLSAQKLVRKFDKWGKPKVRPVTAGEVVGSDYKVVGSINELNYNISTGGGEASIAGIGAGARRYVADIGVDLFLVNTVTTEVVDSVSIKKQLVGFETKAGVYRFWNNNLFDINVGEKKQEPLQLAVRAAMEYAAYKFTDRLYGGVTAKCDMLKDESPALAYADGKKTKKLK